TRFLFGRLRSSCGADELDLTVIDRAPFGVDQDRVGFADSGELLLGELVTGIAVRMQCLGELAEGALDLRQTGLTGDPQRLIEVHTIGGLQRRIGAHAQTSDGARRAVFRVRLALLLRWKRVSSKRRQLSPVPVDLSRMRPAGVAVPAGHSREAMPS